MTGRSFYLHDGSGGVRNHEKYGSDWKIWRVTGEGEVGKLTGVVLIGVLHPPCSEMNQTKAQPVRAFGSDYDLEKASWMREGDDQKQARITSGRQAHWYRSQPGRESLRERGEVNTTRNHGGNAFRNEDTNGGMASYRRAPFHFKG